MAKPLMIVAETADHAARIGYFLDLGSIDYIGFGAASAGIGRYEKIFVSLPRRPLDGVARMWIREVLELRLAEGGQMLFSAPQPALEESS